MSQEGQKITSFEDLIAWQSSRELAILVYQITRDFPKDEIYAMTSQLRRAIISISSNIAEGFSRNTPADRIHFYTIARGSLTEAQSQMILSGDLKYVTKENLLIFKEKSIICHKLVTGLINATKRNLS